MSRIIVSGVGPGMGCSISTVLSQAGHRIAVVSRSEKGKSIAESLSAEYSQCDLSILSEVQESFKKLKESMGGLDGVVHLAGGFFSKRKNDDVDEEYFNKALNNNARTFFNVAKAAIPLLSAGGSIVAISAARNVYTNSHLGYAAGKGAVDYMVKLLANELVPRNIRVNAVSPGFIEKDECGKPKKEEKLGISGRHDASMVARAVEMVLENRMVTGQILEVDAGFSSMTPMGLE